MVISSWLILASPIKMTSPSKMISSKIGSDIRSAEIQHCLYQAYAHHAEPLIIQLAQGQPLSWVQKIERFGPQALQRCLDEAVTWTFTEYLGQLSPPASPCDCIALISPFYRWTQVIDDAFTQHVLMILCGKENSNH